RYRMRMGRQCTLRSRMQLFGLTLVGDAAPVTPSLPNAPRIHRELHARWGRGSIAGEFVLTTSDEFEVVGRVYEREVEINPDLSQRAPIDAMPFDEWRGLAMFASRDRL